MLIVAMTGAALAEDPGGSLDAASVTFSPGQGQASDPLLGWQVWSMPRATWTASGTLQYIDQPLRIQEYSVDGSADPVVRDLVDDLVRLDLGGSFALTDRLGVALSVPLYLTRTADLEGGALNDGGSERGGASMGESRIWLPIALTKPGAGPSAGGFGLSLVPFFDAPSLGAEHFLGSSSFGFGGLVAAGWASGPWSLHANLGAEYSDGEEVCSTASCDDPDAEILLSHERQGLGVVGVAWSGLAAMSLHVDAYAAPAFGGDVLKVISADAPQGDYLTVTTPAELLAYARFTGVNGRDGLSFTVGGASAISSAPGTPRLRVFGGLAFAPPVVEADPNLVQPIQRAAGPTDLVLEVSAADDRKLEAVVQVEGRDERFQVSDDGQAILPLGEGLWTVAVEADGYGRQSREVLIEGGRAQAEQLAVVLHRAKGEGVLELEVTDQQDRLVTDASFTVDGASYGEVGNQGGVRVEGLAEGARRVDVEAEDFHDFDVVEITANQSPEAEVLVMARLAGSVRIRARSPKGPVSDALVRLLGPELLDPVKLDPEGAQVIQLSPGQWTAVISSEQYGLQQREVLIEDDFTGLIDVLFELLPAEAGDAGLSVRVVDPDGAPVEGAEVLLGGKLLGTTASGGALRVEGLAPGPRSLEVRGEHFRPREAVEVELIEGVREVLVSLDWIPGSLKVLARGADGPLADVQVRFQGPAQATTAPLGADGEGFFSLAPGEWTVWLSAPAFGLQTRTVVVKPDETSLLEIKAVLLEDEQGDASLSLAVVDPDGEPVDGAQILLDGELAGTTSSGGTLTLGGLAAGPREIEVRGAQLRDKVLGELVLSAGDNPVDVPMLWKPGSVRVRTRASDGGAVLDALVRLIGPETLPVTRVGADGERVFSLTPGGWTVLVSSEAFGLTQREVKVTPEQEALVELDFELAAAPEQVVVEELTKREVDIIVRTVDGEPVDAEVRFLGAERVDAGKTGASGEASAALRPGSWEVIASAADYGAKRAEFVLEPGDERYEVVIEVGVTQVEVTGTEVKILQQVFFEVDKATIRPESFDLLDEVANTLLVNPKIRRLEVQGHTDNQGGAAYNQELSEARAQSVVDYLVDKGVSARRVEAKGYGQSEPIASNDTPEGRAENRRVQFEIVEQD